MQYITLLSVYKRGGNQGEGMKETKYSIKMMMATEYVIAFIVKTAILFWKQRMVLYLGLIFS